MARGRPGLTPDQYQERLDSYCTRYGVAPSSAGLPPFPAGRRETPEHREWIALYKLHRRLAQRESRSSADMRQKQLRMQRGMCPICAKEVAESDALDYDRAKGRVRGLLHASCEKLVRLSEAAGAETLDRVRAYLRTRG